MNPPVLEAKELSHTFEGSALPPILQDISLVLRAGESLAITGVSGSGKSTLLQILGLLTRPSQGQLLYHGQTIPAHQEALWRNRQIGFVFQHCHLLEESTALENVLMPAAIARWPAGKEAARARAGILLNQVGLRPDSDIPCRLLSGGEKQRVAIARALMNAPSLILADEPSGNLDTKTGRIIHDLLLGTCSASSALCVVTHDPELARRCSRMVRLYQGQLEEYHESCHA
jgi:lipoprotein-releasing system ATP-binding protein